MHRLVWSLIENTTVYTHIPTTVSIMNIQHLMTQFYLYSFVIVLKLLMLKENDECPYKDCLDQLIVLQIISNFSEK